MLLILTNSGDETADYLLSRLADASVPFVRLDTDSALDRITVSYEPGKPAFCLAGRWFEPRDFSAVWYRRPERLVSNRIPDTPEGKCVLDEWSESLEGFFAHIPRNRWMNHPVDNALASRKLEQLSLAQQIGLAIPDTIVTQDAAVLRQFYRRHRGKVIVKPLGRAYIERPEGDNDSLIYTNAVSERELDNLADLANCPTLFQQAIPKRSDVRITVIDGAFHAFELIATDHGQQRCDIRRNNMVDVTYHRVCLPDKVSSNLRTLVSHYRLRFAAIDMAVGEDDKWYFFEVNPNGQWAWLDLCAGANIFQSFVDSFSAAAIKG